MQPYPIESTTLAAAARELREVLDTVPAQLHEFSEEQASRPRRPGGWSRKQILGGSHRLLDVV